MNLCSVKEIMPILEEEGFRFSRQLGQNFLTESWVPEQIAAESGANRTSGVLEIGPGVGCLTKELSRVSGKVCAVELDERLPRVLRKTLADCGNVRIISADIMKLDLEQLVRDEFSGLTPLVCANLPYNITTPVLTKLIESRLFDSMTVMVQKEVAQRLCAEPDSREYGAFGIFVQYHTRPEFLFEVSPGCFTPRPKVTSAVVRLRRRAVPAVNVTDEALYFRLVRAAFSQRRKTLSNSLAAAAPGMGREELIQRIEEAGIVPSARGETLSLQEFAALTRSFA